jgi:putative addiction module component (TIGR02574 family)
MAVDMSDKKITVFDLTSSEKLQLAEDLWDELGATPENVPVHEWQKEELARRAKLASTPASGPSWEEVKRRIRKPHAAELGLAPEAEQDIAEAYAWYEERRIGLGEEFLSCVDACIQVVRRSPGIHPFIHEN